MLDDITFDGVALGITEGVEAGLFVVGVTTAAGELKPVGVGRCTFEDPLL